MHPKDGNRTMYKADAHISEYMTNAAVFVDSRGGNTRKLADAIAGELGVPVGDIAASLPEDAGILFLGSGTYGGKPGEALMKLIGSGNLAGKKVAIFGTSANSAGSEKMIAAMTSALTQKGATILGSWHCPGKFLIMNWGRPNKEDLDRAKKFAREMLTVSSS
jgi:flavodoxin